MRQAGIIAAGALYALENQRDRLADDNANARRLAEGLAAMDGITIDLDAVETNIMYFYVEGKSAEEFCEQLEAKGILMQDQGMTEDEAYKLIRKSSMNKRVSMKEIAEAIILSQEIRKW